MNDRFEPLNRGEVVSVEQETQVLNGQRTFKVDEFNAAIEAHLQKAIAGWNADASAWLSLEGVACEAFRFNSSGWQKGRIRLSLEFCPDEQQAQLGALGKAIPVPAQLSSASDERQPTLDSNSNLAVEPHATAVEPHHATATPIVTDAPPSTATSSLPRVEIITVGAVATATASIPRSVATAEIPTLTDVSLENSSDLGTSDVRDEGLEEITFDFNRPQSAHGTASVNATMELELTDFGQAEEYDLLDVEADGMTDAAYEFINLTDRDERPEYSGMLIDEVWNELNGRNWPGIN